MKKLKYLLILLTVSNIAFAQFQQCDTPTNQNLRDIVFVNENTGIAIGDSGTIIRSTNGGLNWDQIMFNDTIQLRKVKFFDTQNGIAVGTHVLSTDDGGLSWSIQNLTNNIFYDIEILNNSTCIISGSPIAIMKSFDQGNTWNTLVDQNPNQEYGFLSFIDENIGYTCIGSGAGPAVNILKTMDGGVSWSTIELQSGIGNTVIEAFNFVSEGTGFKAGWYEEHLTKTIDSGNNWQHIEYIDTIFYGQIRDFYIETDQPNAYYACGWYGTVVKSIDEGNSWAVLETGLALENEIFNGIYFINDNTGWIAGSNGIIIKVTNGGLTVGIKEAQNIPDFSLYPNPASSYLNIHISSSKKTNGQFNIYDINGSLIMSLPEQIINTGETIIKLNLKNNTEINIKPGIYFLTLEIDNQKITKKFLFKSE